MPGRRYCTKANPLTARRVVQLHCYSQGSPEIVQHLAFRDYLLLYPALAAIYEQEKVHCYSLYADDSHADGDCKAAWIRAVEAEALAPGSPARLPQIGGYKVVLSGVGGDELLFGYGLVREISRNHRRNRVLRCIPGAQGLLRKVIGAFPAGSLHPNVKGIPDLMGSLEDEYLLRRGLFLPGELPKLMGPDEAKEGLQRLGSWLAGIPRVKAVNSEGVPPNGIQKMN